MTPTALDGGAVLNPLTKILLMNVHLMSSCHYECALNVFLPYFFTQLQRVSRIDIVCDQYHENSLKSHTRSKHGKGIMRRFASLPGNRQQLLRINANKRELFSLVA